MVQKLKIITMNNELEKNIKTHQPKVIVGFLIIIGLITITFGFWQLNNYLKTPFIINYQTSALELRAKLAQIKSTAVSRFTDTDHDSLTDYDEINIYKTSPYLEDSDSDGIKDGEEVLKGENPNCPQGQKCIIEVNTNVNYDIIFEDITEPTEQELLAQTIRQALIANGFSEEELAQFDDATLIQMYNQVSTNQSSPNINQQLTIPTDLTKEDLTNYNLEQIKQFLIANGVTEEQLKLIPEDQLLSTWQEILNTL